MHRLNRKAASLAVLSLLALPALAGPIDPPLGPIVPTGKTIAETEPRIAINQTNTPGNSECVYRISSPGSYYLTGNVAGAAEKVTILIQSPHVTLDLNGFTVSGISSGLACIGTDAGRAGVTIKNGVVANGGSNGISLTSASHGARIQDVTLFDCSESSLTVGSGAMIERCTVIDGDTVAFSAGPGSTLRDCTVVTTGDTGFSVAGATLINCNVKSSAGYGFYIWSASSLTNCAATDCGTGFYSDVAANLNGCTARKSTGSGFALGTDSVVANCLASENGVYGFKLVDRGVISNSTASANALDGIIVGSRCLVTGNTCSSNGVGANIGAGIKLAGADARAEGNNVSSNDIGIRADTAGNFIVRNTASGNSTNFSGVAGNAWGTILSAASAGAVAGNTGGGLGSTDPLANFAY